MNHVIVPSLPAASFTELASLAMSLRGRVPELQVDIVDGKFVPPLSWPFTEKDPVQALNQLSLLRKDFEIEMDCMVERPERYLDVFVSLGIGRVVVHMGSTDAYDEIYQHAYKHDYRIGLALLNDRPLGDLQEHISRISFVQLMGIASVGQQGQPFDERTLPRVRALREDYPDLEIAVDGSVNQDTIVALKEAGVNRFLPGSAIVKASDPLSAYQELLALISDR